MTPDDPAATGRERTQHITPRFLALLALAAVGILPSVIALLIVRWIA